jgi:NDP-sugar pyrophosphorylase family protein
VWCWPRAGPNGWDGSPGGGSKALLRLGGLSLVERAVRSLLARRLERVLVVVGHDAGPVAVVVGRLGSGRVRAVCADRWSDGNGASLAAVEVAVAGEALFVLVTADHVFSEGVLDRLLGAGEPAVLVDPAQDRAAWLEGTRVRVVEGAVVGFEKPGFRSSWSHVRVNLGVELRECVKGRSGSCAYAAAAVNAGDQAGSKTEIRGGGSMESAW